jgi:hypothetical protein
VKQITLGRIPVCCLCLSQKRMDQIWPSVLAHEVSPRVPGWSLGFRNGVLWELRPSVYTAWDPRWAGQAVIAGRFVGIVDDNPSGTERCLEGFSND